ncbi:hypothetical protein [Streptomyces sp. SP18CS02]|uniref:hypothetical protein n=1 Tax=Streptomyces sp. SP18CS02 TaxID=3002531 RepID=UPI002E76AB6F|nr:hypothetical protein [Streptomyces sp. SP18CS02]MEE1756789.1 hypothetical protein [Streptomyces sp. SP18CS02]
METIGDEPARACADAPGPRAERAWADRRTDGGRRADGGEGRESRLRRAALLDRLALERPGAEEALAASEAARHLVALDLTDAGSGRGPLSLKGADLVTDDDFRAYVREEYRAWRAASRPEGPLVTRQAP